MGNRGAARRSRAARRPTATALKVAGPRPCGRRPNLQALDEAARDPANLPDGMSPGLDANAYNDSDVFTFPNGCHAAKIEIDPETGSVRLER